MTNQNTSPNENEPYSPAVDRHIVAATASSAGKELVLRRRQASAEVRRTTGRTIRELQQVLDTQQQTLRDPQQLRALCAELRSTDRCPGECVIRSGLRGAPGSDLGRLRRRLQ